MEQAPFTEAAQSEEARVDVRAAASGAGVSAGRLDPPRDGLSARAKGIVRGALEALLCDEDGQGGLVPTPKDTCDRAIVAVADSLGRSGPDLRFGYAVLVYLLEILPLFVIGAPSRMTRLPLARRVEYLEALEASRVGLLAMLFVAFKVPLCISALEEGDELRMTGFDRPDTAARRRLPVAHGNPREVPDRSAPPRGEAAS